ncbi:MAG: hypothetical protein KKB88_05910 [Nanoarchaeota archaeon]|nr:hypothetical protein [Nanoarchaeota archaeon]
MNKQNQPKGCKPIKEIEELKEEIKRRNLIHKEEAIRLKIEPLDDNGWCDTIELETKLQTLQKANKQFAEVLGEEMYFLECIKGWRSWGKMSVFVKKNILNKISHLTQLKKEYEEAGK